MSEHYYSEKPNTQHDLRNIHVHMRGQDFHFRADAGVFSKLRVDFGSVLLINSMEITTNGKVLDVGCGYGPIGIVAAHLASEGQVVLVDVNERALELAEQNIGINHITNALVMKSDGYTAVKDRDFDVILTNPPIRAGKDVVHRIVGEARDYLKTGGALWVVIQKKQGAPSAWKKLEEVFSEVIKVKQDKGYWIIKAVK